MFGHGQIIRLIPSVALHSLRSPTALFAPPRSSSAAAEIVHFGLNVLCFAYRGFCAKLILRRAAAAIVRDQPPLA
jgi:hypothetical protein